MTSLAFRLNKIDETKNYILEELKHNDLMSEKNKKVCKSLNYFGNDFVFVSAVSGCVSVSAFVSLLGIPIEITSSALGSQFVHSLQELKSIINYHEKKEKP